jgi:hypothetical protein
MTYNISIVINSCKPNIDISLKHLLDSIKLYNPGLQVISIIGGCHNEDAKSDNNYTTVRTKHNSIDFTGLIAIIEQSIPTLTTPFIFYMHDTCKIGPDFFTKLLAVDLKDNKTYGIHRPGMNIGIYSIDILHKHKNTLLSLKNSENTPESIHKYKELGVHKENIIFKENKNHEILIGTRTVSPPHDYYNTGVMRIVEYYGSLDLYKIKANWRRKITYELRL